MASDMAQQLDVSNTDGPLAQFAFRFGPMFRHIGRWSGPAA
jgi:hypothetical protein